MKKNQTLYIIIGLIVAFLLFSSPSKKEILATGHVAWPNEQICNFSTNVEPAVARYTAFNNVGAWIFIDFNNDGTKEAFGRSGSASVPGNSAWTMVIQNYNSYGDDMKTDGTRLYVVGSSGYTIFARDGPAAPNAEGCIYIPPEECTDDCPGQGINRCIQMGGGQSQWYTQGCGNYDDDPCIEWGNDMLCPYGCTQTADHTCNSGPQCQDDCTSGTTCSGRYKQFCGQYDTDFCTEFGGNLDCGVNSCDAGTNFCEGNILKNTKNCVDRGCSGSAPNADCFANSRTSTTVVQDCGSSGCSNGACITQTTCTIVGDTAPACDGIKLSELSVLGQAWMDAGGPLGSLMNNLAAAGQDWMDHGGPQ